MSEDRWRDHYGKRHSEVKAVGVARSLDYSNERVRIQTYAHLLEGLGEVSGKRFLDAGCGWGSMAILLHGCGASVTAADLVPETIEQLRRDYPFISWTAMDLADAAAVRSLPDFDGIVAAEVLQYLDFETVVESLWNKVNSGGVLAASVPNAGCEIARRVAERDQGWVPVDEGRIRALAGRLPSATDLRMNGLSFRDDQTFLPYRASGWGDRIDGSPNRLLFAVHRA